MSLNEIAYKLDSDGDSGWKDDLNDLGGNGRGDEGGRVDLDGGCDLG